MSDQPKDPNNPHGPVQVHELTVQVDKDLCIGAATCVAITPKVFLLDSEAKAIILTTAEEETEEAILDSARGCPVAAIYLEKNGQRIYPS